MLYSQPYPNFSPNQSVSAPTAFAQLHAVVLGVSFARDVAPFRLSDSFGSRINKGALHWSY